MKLIELTRLSGTKFSVNPYYVAYVAPAESGTNLAMPSGSVFVVKEDYATVASLLAGAATGRDTLGRFAPDWRSSLAVLDEAL